MHPYVTDSSERKNIVLGLALVSVVLALILADLIRFVNLSIPWWVDAPSVLGIFGLLYKAFDFWLWGVPVLRKLGLVNVPNLNGEWVGECSSSFDNHAHHYAVTILVQQTWTHMSILLQSDRSHSHSLTASILLNQLGGKTLSYEYWNEPNADSEDTMHSHRGTAVLRLLSDSELGGEYYTGRDRGNFGKIRMRRAPHV